MDIRNFAAVLSEAIERAVPSEQLVNEAAFERHHIIEPAWELSRVNPEIRVFSHPEKRRARCTPTCDAGALKFTHRVEGCPRCWARSKARCVADAFGTRNNFDLAAIDRSGGSLAVEVKWLSLAETRGPNAEFQRFVGQCVLAATANSVVIGVCGFRGRRKRQLDAHESTLKAKLKEIGVHLIVLRAQS